MFKRKKQNLSQIISDIRNCILPSKEILANKEYVLAIIHEYYIASIEYLYGQTDDWGQFYNKTITKTMVERYGSLVPHISKELQDDEEVILEILKYDRTGTVYNNISDRLKNDKDFIKRVEELLKRREEINNGGN